MIWNSWFKCLIWWPVLLRFSSQGVDKRSLAEVDCRRDHWLPWGQAPGHVLYHVWSARPVRDAIVVPPVPHPPGAHWRGGAAAVDVRALRRKGSHAGRVLCHRGVPTARPIQMSRPRHEGQALHTAQLPRCRLVESVWNIYILPHSPYCNVCGGHSFVVLLGGLKLLINCGMYCGSCLC